MAGLDLEWFRDLAGLAQTGSFSKAAALSHVSQSAFSRRIQALERWVGTTLVDRSAHPITLNEAGRQMLEAGEQAVSRIEVERDHIRESLESPDEDVVTFATQHSIGWTFFPAWLQALEQAFGPITSRLRADNLPDCIADLHRGEVDLLIAYHSDHDHGLEDSAESASVRIGSDQLIPVSRGDTAGRALFCLDDARARRIPYLRFGPSAPIGKHLEPVLAAGGLGTRLDTVYENSMVGALRIRARDGLGLAWLPRSLIGQDIDSGLLTLAGGEAWWIDLEIRLHLLRDNHNELAQRIWRFLAARNGTPLL